LSRRLLTAIVLCAAPALAWPHPRKTPRAHPSALQEAPLGSGSSARPSSATTTLPQSAPPRPLQPGAPLQPPASSSPAPAVVKPQAPPAPPSIPPRRFGRFDLDQSIAQLRALPDLKGCDLSADAGHADCALPRDADKLLRALVAWESSGAVIALRLVFDPQAAPALTDLEWQLTRGWGPPVLEQLRREKDQKILTLEWEDAEHRATLEAQGSLAQPSRAIAVTLERRQLPLSGELTGLRPRPFPGFRIRWVKRVEWDGTPHALLWGTSLSPAQEALGENGPAWATQRNYVGLWKLAAAGPQQPRRWRPLWERETGGDDEDEAQRVLRVDARDVTGDGVPDVEVELSCDACGATTSELIVKTVRAGKLVDLLARRELFHAQVEMAPGQVRIREPDGEDQGSTVSTYAYDRGKGAFVLAREERLGSPRE
jgi:hypothetical protein